MNGMLDMQSGKHVMRIRWWHVVETTCVIAPTTAVKSPCLEDARSQGLSGCGWTLLQRPTSKPGAHGLVCAAVCSWLQAKRKLCVGNYIQHAYALLGPSTLAALAKLPGGFLL